MNKKGRSTDFRVIIAGGRDFNDKELLNKNAAFYLKEIPYFVDIIIVSGTAKGADTLGEQFAEAMGLAIERFPAPWKEIAGKPANEIGVSKGRKYWKRAGLVRNERMAKVADACLVFWDGKSRGTKNMIEIAKKYNLKLRTVRY